MIPPRMAALSPTMKEPREDLGDPGAVQAELVDQVEDRVVAGRARRGGDREDAEGDREDDDAAGGGDVAELGHRLLQVEGEAGESGRAWRRASRQRRCGGRWLNGSVVDVDGAGSGMGSNRLG
jgi:hypothetical protein